MRTGFFVTRFSSRCESCSPNPSSSQIQTKASLRACEITHPSQTAISESAESTPSFAEDLPGNKIAFTETQYRIASPPPIIFDVN